MIHNVYPEHVYVFVCVKLTEAALAFVLGCERSEL